MESPNIRHFLQLLLKFLVYNTQYFGIVLVGNFLLRWLRSCNFCPWRRVWVTPCCLPGYGCTSRGIRGCLICWQFSGECFLTHFCGSKPKANHWNYYFLSKSNKVLGKLQHIQAEEEGEKSGGWNLGKLMKIFSWHCGMIIWRTIN